MINLTIELDASNQGHMAAAAAFFGVLTGGSVEIDSPKKEEAPKKEEETSTEEVRKPGHPSPGKTRRTKAEIEEDELAAKKAEGSSEEPKEVEESKEDGIKIKTIRDLISEKVKTHRDAIKPKLTELGAANVTALDPAKYQEFYDFLIGLK
jgi:hypothetical protein